MSLLGCLLRWPRWLLWLLLLPYPLLRWWLWMLQVGWKWRCLEVEGVEEGEFEELCSVCLHDEDQKPWWRKERLWNETKGRVG